MRISRRIVVLLLAAMLSIVLNLEAMTMEVKITMSQVIFTCCLFFFGPAFGFWAARKTRGSRLDKFIRFVFATLAAYAGWFISGITALLFYPHYPEHGSPGELVASLFTIPGFITGWLSLVLLGRIRHARATMRIFALSCALTGGMISLGFYVVFWRCPPPIFLELPPGSRVMVSRPAMVMLEGTSYYLRAWCPGKPEDVLSAVALSMAKDGPCADPDYPNLTAISQLQPSRIYKKYLMEGFFPSVWAGPPQPTSEGYSFQCGDDTGDVGVGAWPDGENTQIELTIDHSLP